MTTIRTNFVRINGGSAIRVESQHETRAFFRHGPQVYEFHDALDAAGEIPVSPDRVVGNGRYTATSVCGALADHGVPLRVTDDADLAVTIRAEWRRMVRAEAADQRRALAR